MELLVREITEQRDAVRRYVHQMEQRVKQVAAVELVHLALLVLVAIQLELWTQVFPEQLRPTAEWVFSIH